MIPVRRTRATRNKTLHDFQIRSSSLVTLRGIKICFKKLFSIKKLGSCKYLVFDFAKQNYIDICIPEIIQIPNEGSLSNFIDDGKNQVVYKNLIYHHKYGKRLILDPSNGPCTHWFYRSSPMCKLL